MRALALTLLLPACVVDTSLIKNVVDTGEQCEPVVAYVDEDGDGFGGGEPIGACEGDVGYVFVGGDCDDADTSVHPEATELCNEVDDDCDGAVDDDAEDAQVYWLDGDGDGFGAEEVLACALPEGGAEVPGDCDDADPAVNPAGTEVCDGVDQDCDGLIDDEASDAPEWFYDGDSDGYGVPDPNTFSCEQPSGYADNPDDCDDSDPTRDLSCAEPTPTPGAVCTGGYQPYTYVDSNASEPELHLLSLYEGTNNGNPPQVTVDIDRGTEMVLHLSAYDAVEWTVNNNVNANITEILVSGYHTQTVNAPSGVPVSVRTYDTTRSNFGNWCGYSLPYNGGGCDTTQLMSGVESYTGLTTSSFAGCYQGQSFRLQ